MKLKSVLFACLLAVTGSGLAATTFTYQGQLQDGDGPFNGSVDLTISLFDAETFGSVVGTPIDLNNVDVRDGLFQVELNFGQVFDGDPKWIEIKVGETTLTPRQRLSSVPVAQYALSSAGSVWQLSGNDIWYIDGNVGIGTDSPSTDLVVRGSVTLGNTNNEASATYSFAGGSGSVASGTESFIAGGRDNKADGRGAFVGGGIDNVADGQFSFAAGRAAQALHDGSFVWAAGSWKPFPSTNDNQFLVRAQGGVGINTNEPAAPLHVVGDTVVMGNTAIGGFPEDYRLGVGTPTPWTTLHVVSNDEQDPLRVMVGNNNASSTAIRAYGHQGVAIGNSWSDTFVPERGLRVHGRITTDSTLLVGQLSSMTEQDLCIRTNGILGQCSSSQRYKENIRDLESPMSLLRKLWPVRYNWIETGNPDIGLIAEEVAEVLPEIVHFNDEGELEGFQYSRLGAILVGAVQELHAELEARNTEITVLRRELAEQRRAYDERLAALEALLLDGSQVAEHVPN